MNQLIVALDNQNPQDLAWELNQKLNINFFKLRFPGLCQVGETWLKSAAENHIKIFADLKLCDTEDSILFNDLPWLIDHGIFAVSTFTDEVTKTLLNEPIADILKVWQVHCLTDSYSLHPLITRSLIKPPAGVICPGTLAVEYQNLFGNDIETVVPGVRLNRSDNFHGHTISSTCEQIKNRADYIIVGRPIWQNKNPIQAAEKFLEALK